VRTGGRGALPLGVVAPEADAHALSSADVFGAMSTSSLEQVPLRGMQNETPRQRSGRGSTETAARGDGIR
jgi:hypothetical protein